MEMRDMAEINVSDASATLEEQLQKCVDDLLELKLYQTLISNLSLQNLEF